MSAAVRHLQIPVVLYSIQEEVLAPYILEDCITSQMHLKKTHHFCLLLQAHFPRSAMRPAPRHMHRKADTITLIELFRISGLNMNS